jgi:predicted heme/steroid binding protein
MKQASQGMQFDVSKSAVWHSDIHNAVHTVCVISCKALNDIDLLQVIL